jgi:hypothetical protein
MPKGPKDLSASTVRPLFEHSPDEHSPDAVLSGWALSSGPLMGRYILFRNQDGTIKLVDIMQKVNLLELKALREGCDTSRSLRGGDKIKRNGFQIKCDELSSIVREKLNSAEACNRMIQTFLIHIFFLFHKKHTHTTPS